MPQRKRLIVSLLIILCMSCSIFCLMPTFFIGRDVLPHQIRLLKYARDFEAMPYPPDTQRLDTYKTLGLLTGNGNHCDIFVGELRSYSGDRTVIQEFYKHEYPSSMLGVVFTENGDLPRESDSLIPSERGRLAYWNIPPGIDPEHVYLVFSFTFIDFDPGFDVRCY
jgi:hypothetical protein